MCKNVQGFVDSLPESVEVLTHICVERVNRKLAFNLILGSLKSVPVWAATAAVSIKLRLCVKFEVGNVLGVCLLELDHPFWIQDWSGGGCGCSYQICNQNCVVYSVNVAHFQVV